MEQMKQFIASLDDIPTAMLLANFLEIASILQRFIFYEREACWTGHLLESAQILPYLAAAGHYKYGLQSLPQYIVEMKKSQELHDALMKGIFVGRRFP